jgi:hypothetical protein
MLPMSAAAIKEGEKPAVLEKNRESLIKTEK